MQAKQIEYLRQKNVLLEQTLSSENRLKQDLFRALNDSKAEIAVLTGINETFMVIVQFTFPGIINTYTIEKTFVTVHWHI